MAPRMRSVLWVDDEAELLEPHRLFLRDHGYDVQAASNADDAIAMLQRHSFDVVLLDEQMPGKRGLDAFKEMQAVSPATAVVMVTKSEDDATLREALGANVRDYLVKPVTPRQVLTAITRLLDGEKFRQQAISRGFAERFRELEAVRSRDLDWRGWIERFDELMKWDVELAGAGETGLYESLRGLYPAMQRDFAEYMKGAYPKWCNDLQGDRPPLSVDVVSEFLAPLLAQHRAAVFIVVDCLRLDQWKVLEPLLAPWFDCDVTHYFSILPTATPYARNALFSGLFPGEIAARFPDWWRDDRDDESLNAHERPLLEAHLKELRGTTPVRYEKLTTARDTADLDRRMHTAIAPDGVSAFVFNFVDMLTHGRSESLVLAEVAKDEIALRALTKQWFERSALFSLLKEAARRKVPVLLTSDHGAVHCLTPATVYAKKDASPNLRFKMGEDLRAEHKEHALIFHDPTVIRLPRRAMGVTAMIATGDAFFVYPTKLREYQARYRGSFLHGGVAPEEVILPLALLSPRG